MRAASGTLSKTRFVVILATGIVVFLLGLLTGYFAVSGVKPESCEKINLQESRAIEMQKKEEYHSKLYKTLNAENIGNNVKYYSKRPHHPGSPRSKELADEIAQKWTEYNFDRIEMPKYNVLLPYANPNISNKVQIVDVQNNKVLLEFSGKEKIVDPSEDDEKVSAPFLGYAKEGSASGKLLYVNYGRTEDFDALRENFSIPNCNGYIAIMRYGRTFRGNKVLNARKCGAEGAILYDDPEYVAPLGQDKVYPEYIWLPKTGVQRGSIFTGTGDPITPGLPSVDGVFRISHDEANLPQIPATPLSYGDAAEIMKLMKGEEVPESWRGALNMTYRLGNGGIKGNAIVRIDVNFPNREQDIYNVIGTIYGKQEPDRWIMVGNHRDAWGFGAVDPSSGTGVMMEISRGLSELLKQGWRPRRTIKFCSWGAEEAALIGSTEWVEQNERALVTKGVAYINVDVAVAGTHNVILSGSPLFKAAVNEIVKNVKDPHFNSNGARMTVYERMMHVIPGEDGIQFYTLGSGSDYATFYQFVGVPALDMYYFGEILYPVYHSVHDTYKWLQSLVDPYFTYHLTITEVAARILMSTADSILLPFNVLKYGKYLEESLDDLNHTYGAELRQNNVTLHYIDYAIAKYVDASAKFQQRINQALDFRSDMEIRDLNDRMVNVEKSFIYGLGLPRQKFRRHVIFAPPLNDNYGSASFPGISDLMFLRNKTRQDWENIMEQTSIVYKAIMSAVSTLDEGA